MSKSSPVKATRSLSKRSNTSTNSFHTSSTSRSITSRSNVERELKHRRYDELKQELTESTLKERWYANSLHANMRLGCKVLMGGVVAYVLFRSWWIAQSLAMQDDNCKIPMTTIKWVDLLFEIGFGISICVALCFPRPKLYYGVLCFIAVYCGLFSLLPSHDTCDEAIDRAVCKQSNRLYKWALAVDCSPQGEAALSFNVVIIITSPVFVPHFRTTIYFLCFLIAMVGLATMVHRTAYFSYHNGWDCLISFLLLAGAAAIALRTKFVMQRREMSLCIVENRRQHAAQRVYHLLKNMVPEFIVPRLLEDPDSLIADSLERVSVFFMKISDFEVHVQNNTPAELLDFLNLIFTRMDSICKARKVTKIETVGEEYVAAVGISPGDRQTSHQVGLGRLIEMSLDVLLFASAGVSVRMGIHTGPVVAGVIGYKLPRFRLFGSTINIAARMMQKGADGELQFGEATRKELPAWVKTRCRGPIDMKGLGEVVVHLLDPEATRARKVQDELQIDGFEVSLDDVRNKLKESGERRHQGVDEQSWQLTRSQSVTIGAVSDLQPALTRDKSSCSINSETSRNSTTSLQALVQQLSASSDREALESEDVIRSVTSASMSSSKVGRMAGAVYLSPEQYTAWMANFYEKRLYRNLRRTSVIHFTILLILTIIEVLIASSEPVFKHDSTAEAYFVTRALLLIGILFWSLVVYFARKRTRERLRLLESWRFLGLCLTTLLFSLSYSTLQLDERDFSGMSAAQVRSIVLSRPYRIRIWELMGLLFFSTVVVNVTLRFKVALIFLAVILAIMNIVRYIVLEEEPLSNLSLHAAEVSVCLMALQFAVTDEQNDKRDFKESFILDMANDRIEGLLKMLLPPMVVDDLTTHDVKAAPPSHSYFEASIAQSDLVGFTQLCKNLRPDEVIRIVEDLFGLFDELTETYGVYKVETVGDAYIAGMAEQPLTSMNSVANVVMFARGIIEKTQQWARDNSEEVDCRVGVHFGSCIGGIVGRKMRRYHLFGKLLSELELLESTAPPGKVQISKACWDAVQTQTHGELLPDVGFTASQRQDLLLFTSKKDPVEYDQVGGPTLIVEDLHSQQYPGAMKGKETKVTDDAEYTEIVDDKKSRVIVYL